MEAMKQDVRLALHSKFSSLEVNVNFNLSTTITMVV